MDIGGIRRADPSDLFPSVSDGSVDPIVCAGPDGIAANGWGGVGDIQRFNRRLIRIFAEKLKDGGA